MHYYRHIAFLGLLWGFGFFLGGLWWLGASFHVLVVPAVFLPAMICGIVLFCLFLALFPATGILIAGFFWTKGSLRIFALAFGLSCSEWMRGHILTGFPWNLPGMMLAQHLYLMQIAALGGIYLMTFISLVIFAMPATLLSPSKEEPQSRYLWQSSLLAALALAALTLYGYMRIPADDSPVAENIRFRLVQPHIQQDEKFNIKNSARIMQHYLDLSTWQSSGTGYKEKRDSENQKLTKAPADITHIVWPETAFPFILDQSPEAVRALAAILPENSVLITGAARMEAGLPGEESGDFYNSLALVDSNENLSWIYDKKHLVPFGETTPLFIVKLVHWLHLDDLVNLPGGYTAPPSRRHVTIPGFSTIAATICYEAVFSGEVLSEEASGQSPDLLLNVTNDGWFGTSPGPYQHFAQARLRAVEEGLPLLRLANTGISAVIDPYGRIIAQTRLGESTVLDSFIPLPLERKTLFAQWRNSLFFIIMLACFFLLMRARTDRNIFRKE